jgi:hypothetical protein
MGSSYVLGFVSNKSIVGFKTPGWGGRFIALY